MTDLQEDRPTTSSARQLATTPVSGFQNKTRTQKRTATSIENIHYLRITLLFLFLFYVSNNLNNIIIRHAYICIHGILSECKTVAEQLCKHEALSSESLTGCDRYKLNQFMFIFYY